MYELKKIGYIFTSKFVGTGHSSFFFFFFKRIYRAAVSQRLINTVLVDQLLKIRPTPLF